MEDSLRGRVGGLCTWAKDTEDLYHGGRTQDRKWPCGTGWGMFWLLVDIVQGLAIALAGDLVYAIG